MSRADLHRRLLALEQRTFDQAEPLLVWVDQGEDVVERLEQARLLHPARRLVAMGWQRSEPSRL